MSYKDLHIPRYTYNDYVNWEGRWELIEGHPIAMSPLPVPEHQEVSLNLMIELKSSIQKSNCKHCKVYPPLDYKISDNTTLQPDILIVCEKIEKKFLDFPPTVVVEILSPSTMLRDRNTKFHIYQQQQIPYYLLVDVEKKSIEINRLADGIYKPEKYKKGFEMLLDDNCRISLFLDDIWV